ncbi:MAG TPA: hypothetical protein VLA75_11330 [Thermoanaerobaculia bacterium]|nr:hypothetical protein [Thermoanaerobaculia bacterium]
MIGQALVVVVLLASLRRVAVAQSRWPTSLRIVLLLGALGLVLGVLMPIVLEGAPREDASRFLSGALVGVALTAAVQPGIWRRGTR